MMKRFPALLLAAILLSLPLVSTHAQTAKMAKAAKAVTRLNPVAVKSANEITAEQMKDYLTFIAADELEGRNTPSRGLDIAAKFIAAHLSRWGYKPAGDNGTYFQRIPLRGGKVDAANTYAEINGQTYKYGTDVLANNGNTKASGSLVYAAHGWVIKSKNIDAYQGLDVKGKIVVIKGGLPQGVTLADLQQDREALDPSAAAKANGAVGIIVLPTQQTLNNWERSRSFQERERFTMGQAANNDATLPSIVVSMQVAQKLFEGEAKNPLTDANIGAFDLSADKKATISVANPISTTYTQNVVAVLEGSDPKLKNEYVAIGAHYDHVGINLNAPAGTDNIFNGADDDGSGTVAILAMAEAFAKAAKKPKRSIIFVWHAGEEKGLWGSRYFTDNPTVPLESITAQINIDMIGRSKKEGDTNQANKMLTSTNEIYIIGATMMSTTLGDLSDTVNNSYLKLGFNKHYDAPNDPERLFFRSDHYSYARKGIPVLFFFDGVHEDYHKVGDHVDKIDFQKMEKVTRTVYVLAWSVAELPVRPAVDKPLPEQLRQGR